MKKTENLNKYFDHTLLKADACEEDIKKLCAEAQEYDFYSVCVNSAYVPLAVRCLKGTDVKTAAVAGFPLGAAATGVKAFEAQWACAEGTEEIDMVINIGALKAGRYDYVRDDIQAVAAAVKKHGGVLKVILETCMLTDEEIIKACGLAVEAGADFVKTSTGFSKDGAKQHHVELMKSTVGKGIGVKASGGIRDLETALKMIEAGADRIGASASVEIMKKYAEAVQNQK